jgi:hypothetical protein
MPRKKRQLRPAFRSQYEQMEHENGREFEVLGLVDKKTYDAKECGPMYRIKLLADPRFDTCELIIEAWPEEIYKD